MLTVLVAFVAFVGAPPAGDAVYCPPNSRICYVIAAVPGDPVDQSTGIAKPAASTSLPPCHQPNSVVAVECSNQYGSWSNANGCYYKPVDSPPPLTDPLWKGNTTGAIYAATCPGTGGTGGGWLWMDSAPGGGAVPSAAEIAARAVSMLELSGPEIGMAPRPGSTGLVGLPVWMWTTVSASTWGPVSATASVPGISVTATAKAAQVVWDMGDGHSVTCHGPGTPYTVARGAAMSPTCGHRYLRSSAGMPGEAFTVTATTTWQINWSGGGASGVLTQTRSSTLPVRIGELQLLVT